MVYRLSYRRPAYVSDNDRSSQTSDDENSRSKNGSLSSGHSGISAGIPEALAFDKIISDGTCPPCTTRDFMNYLVYVEHSAENLQFFLWYRNYVQRFNEANTTDINLAPEWTQAQHDAAVQAAQVQATAQKKAAMKGNVGPAEIFKGTDFDASKSHMDMTMTKDPFTTPPRTPGENNSESGSIRPWDSMHRTSELDSTYTVSNKDSYRHIAGEAFESAGLKKPFTIQPFREEVDRVIATYFMKGTSTRELNISDRERIVLLKALEYTTHPSAFRAVNSTIETSLRQQSHPNFIRWVICNGNPPRVYFARGLGVGLILIAFVAAILLTLSNAGRGWRALAAIGWMFGVATLISAAKGMCVVLHGLHHRHLRPWELFEESEPEFEMKKGSFDTLSTAATSANSYEDAPWVEKYKKRNVIRKIFDREVWIKEPALRQIQDTIFLQSMLVALIITIVCTAVFVVLPGGSFY